MAKAREKWKQLDSIVDDPEVSKVNSMKLGESTESRPRRPSMRALGSLAFDQGATREAIAKVPLYSGCSEKFLEALAEKVTSRLVLAGQDIMVEGHLGDCLHVVSRGTCEMLKGKEVVDTSQDGAVFGALASISKVPHLVQREWTVRATSLCDVKTLRREDVTLMLSHFKDDAILVEKQVERHVAEMQKKGAIPAKKEWWQMQRHSVASTGSAQTEKCSEGFRAAVGRALTGIKLARRFSLGAAVGAMGVEAQRPRRMSDGMLMARPQRQSSKSSQCSLTSILEAAQLEDTGQASSSSSSSSSSSQKGDEADEPIQATHSITVVQAMETASELSEFEGMPKNLTDLSPQSVSTVKFEDPLPHATRSPRSGPTPSLPEIEWSLKSIKSDGEEVTPMSPKMELRLLMIQQRHRDVAMHPLNQGAFCGGFPVCATRRAMRLSHAAALRVCRTAPINGAAARHRSLAQRRGVWQPTVASKSRRRKARELPVLEASTAKEVPAMPMTLWQEFQSRSNL